MGVERNGRRSRSKGCRWLAPTPRREPPCGREARGSARPRNADGRGAEPLRGEAEQVREAAQSLHAPARSRLKVWELLVSRSQEGGSDGFRDHVQGRGRVLTAERETVRGSAPITTGFMFELCEHPSERLEGAEMSRAGRCRPRRRERRRSRSARTGSVDSGLSKSPEQAPQVVTHGAQTTHMMTHADPSA